jgi:hypothetical protein
VPHEGDKVAERAVLWVHRRINPSKSPQPSPLAS